MPTKEWIQEIIEKTVKEFPVCREGTGSQNGTPGGSDVSFNIETSHANITSLPPDGTDAGFGFGQNESINTDPGIYAMDTAFAFVPVAG